MIKRILFILVLCLLIITPIVSAATVTGVLGESSVQTNNYAGLTPNNVGAGKIQGLFIRGTSSFTSPPVGVVFLAQDTAFSYDAGAPSGASVTVSIRNGSASGAVVGHGTFGYQRLYDNAVPPVAQYCYLWLAFSDLNLTGIPETDAVNHYTKLYFADFSQSQLYNISGLGGSSTLAPTGSIFFEGIGGGRYGGVSSFTTTNNLDTSVYATYTATAPSGIGISGTIVKNNGGASSYQSRGYVFNSTGAVIASEGTASTNTYNFSSYDSSLKLGIYANSKFYNSSVLFSGGGLPTPTPTPTPIPTPTGVGYEDDTTGTFYIRDGLNQTLLANAYIELHYSTAQSSDLSIMGYTDSVGKIIFQGLTNTEEYEARIWKSGYQYSQYTFIATPVAFSKTFYMYPDTGTTTTLPSQINVTVRVMDKTTYSPISGAYVVARDTLTGSFSTTALPTNATGYAVFMGIPNSANIGGTITKTGYVYQLWNVPYQASTGTFMPDGDVIVTVQLTPVSAVTPTGTIVTPTPTPVSIDKLILTATPDSINLGSSVSLTGSSSNATRLTYAGGLRRTSFYLNVHPSTYPVDFRMVGQFENVNATYWKFRPNSSVAWNTPTTASPLTMVHTPTSNGLITYSFSAYDTASGGTAIAQSATDDVLVGGGAGGGSLTIAVGAYDATTSGRLQDFALNITDEGSGVVTEFGTVNFMQEITLPRGNGYVLRATKEGYQTSSTIGESGTLLFVVPVSQIVQKGSFGAVFNIPMFPDGAITVGNTSISVRVYDIETYYPLSNVQVTNSYAPTDIKYTGEEDSVSWNIPQNTGYTLTALKSGYCTVTQSKNTSTNSYQFVPMYLKYGSCSGATPTPTPTGTPTPTITPIGGWGNTTGEAIVCGDLPEDATIVDILKNSLACNGLEDAQSQNLGIAMLIILFAAIVLGRVAKGVGVLAGVIAGTVLSTVAGFLPFWIIIVVIIIAGLVFAGKVFWSSGQ